MEQVSNSLEILSSLYNLKFQLSDNKLIINNNSLNYQIELIISDYKVKPTIDNLETKLLTESINNQKYFTIQDYIEVILKEASELPNFCISCNGKLKFNSDILTTCGSDKCKYKLENVVVDNFVSEYLKNNLTTAQFLMDVTKYVLDSPQKIDLFDPFPSYFLKKDLNINIERGKVAKINLNKIDFDNYNNQKDIDKLIKTFNSINLNKIVNDLIIIDDNLLKKVIGDDVYFLLRFIFKSCNISIELDKLDGKTKIYNVKNIYTDEEKFKENLKLHNNQFSYLYHGSPLHCWHSIIRNGLVVTSNTSLMTTGASYGKGIYMSDNYSVSYGYCKNVNPIMGVYEIIGDKETYCKATGFYVIPSNEICILRYLIVGAPPNINENLNRFFIQEMCISKKIIQNKMLEKGIKKLTKELDDIKKENFYKIELVDNQVNHWLVELEKAKLEIKFPDLYPFEPPFIFINSPIFTEDSKYITDKGSLCYEYLTPNNWLPAISIKNVILQIDYLIIHPGKILKKGIYDFETAKKSFDTLANGNGWFN